MSTESVDVTPRLRPADGRDPGCAPQPGHRGRAADKLPDGTVVPAKPGKDYRVLQPALVMDPNRNRTAVAFDALGMVVGTAVMGKPEDDAGRQLDGFDPNLTEAEILDHLAE